MKLLFKILILIYLLIINYNFDCNVFCQNLVNNPSFEENIRYPDNQQQIKLVKYWNYEFKSGVADYFHECSPKFDKKTGKMTGICIPRTCMGYQFPHSGKAYVGIIVDKTGRNNCIQNLLKSKLKQGYVYQLDFFISRAEIVACATNAIGVYFSTTDVSKLPLSQRLKLIPQIRNPATHILSDTAGWTKISGRYTAQGGEQYLMIGGFSNIDSIVFLKGNGKKPFFHKSYYNVADYFIDDVSLVAVDSSQAPKSNQEQQIVITQKSADTINTIQLNKTYTFNNLNFADNSSVIPTESYPDLDKLIDFLKKNVHSIIEIAGHTDNSGSEEHNNVLSLARAKAVADYLKLNGIEEYRIIYNGYGSKIPITENDTEKGKAKNRRVEFIVKEKDK